MYCDICKEDNISQDHNVSQTHLKNKTLSEFSKSRKQCFGNRKGIVVSCNVESSLSTIPNVVDAKIKVSIKPNEEVKFHFCIKNETNKEDIIFNYTQLAHSLLKFTLNKNGTTFSQKPVTLAPKETASQEIVVSFKSGDIGQYEMPILFSFYKPAMKEQVTILRDMVVFVEHQQQQHKKQISPFTQIEVTASKLFKTNSGIHGDDLFRIPKNYKEIYASGLNMRADAPQEKKDLCREIKEVFQNGASEETYVPFFHNLLWYEETIARINLKNFNMAGVPLWHQGNGCYSLLVPGLAEKRPSLMPGDLLFVRPHERDDVMFEAIIHDIASENVANIRGFNHAFVKYYDTNAKFDIRFFMSRLSLERMHFAVNTVTKGSPEQCRVFPQENTKNVKVKPISNYYNNLVEENPEQRTAVEHIVAGTAGSAPYIVHGPPGTGKTVTIVEAILQLVNKNPSNRILVCTDSNMAADHVGSLLIKYAHMFQQEHFLLRANSMYRTWETLPECLKKYSNGSNRESFYSVPLKDFISYSIVITTLSHAAKFAREMHSKKKGKHITHLFIDEAAQASEPACLIPTCGLLAPRGALVLAGDPLQLAPVVISHAARRLGLGVSLMERLQKTCSLYSDERNDSNYMVMLRNNFRSDRHILELPNELFYKGQLRALASEDPISATDILGEREHSRAVVFHGVLSKEQKMGKSPSFYNNMELEIVQRYINALIKEHNVLPEDIGVVTPYIRQVYKIKTWLQTLKLGAKIEVGTVEAFQGKEKRVIIISTVRANCALLDHDAKFQLGFLVDDKRFNVALTRAKAKVIIIGNPMCLQRDVKWLAYIQKCREYGTYFGYDSELFKDEEKQKEIVQRLTPLLNELKINNKTKT